MQEIATPSRARIPDRLLAYPTTHSALGWDRRFSMVMEPQRQHPRYAHEATLAIHANGVVHRGTTTNLSKGGLCADLPDSLAVGTDVLVDIALVFDHNFKSEPLQVQARVVWCTAVDGGRQIGLSFQRLRADQSEYLTLFLRYLDHSTRDRIRSTYKNVDDRFC